MIRKDNVKDIQAIIDLYSRLFIIGTGSSLNDIDTSEWSKLRNELTFGISFSYKKFMPHNLMWGDQYFTDIAYKEKLCKQTNLIMRSDAFDKNRYNERMDFKSWIEFNVAYIFDVKKYKGHLTSSWLLQILKDYEGIIYLLGFDFYPGHCYDEKDVGFDPALSWVTNNLDEAIKQHEGFDMNIINCNRKSKLKLYPFGDLKAVL